MEGSEHCIDGKYYPVELHLVHVKEGYTLAEDLEKPDGIVVVGVFMKIGKIGRKMENLEESLKVVVKHGNHQKGEISKNTNTRVSGTEIRWVFGNFWSDRIPKISQGPPIVSRFNVMVPDFATGVNCRFRHRKILKSYTSLKTIKEY